MYAAFSSSFDVLIVQWNCSPQLVLDCFQDLIVRSKRHGYYFLCSLLIPRAQTERYAIYSTQYIPQICLRFSYNMIIVTLHHGLVTDRRIRTRDRLKCPFRRLRAQMPRLRCPTTSSPRLAIPRKQVMTFRNSQQSILGCSLCEEAGSIGPLVLKTAMHGILESHSQAV